MEGVRRGRAGDITLVPQALSLITKAGKSHRFGRIIMLRRCGLVMLLTCVGLSAQAQGPAVKLEWKFKEGDKFYLENITSLKQVVKIMGQEIPTESVNTTISSFKVTKVGADEIVLEQKIEASKIKGGQPGPQAMMAEQMVGTVLTVTLNRKGEVTKIAGFDVLLKKLSQDNEEVGKLLKFLLTEDTMKQGIQEAFAFVPDKPVSKGDSWKRQMKVSMGPMGTFSIDQQYTLNGVGKEGAAIGVTGIYNFTPPKGDGGGGLPFKITKGDFKTDNAKGTLIFDPVAGRLVSQTYQSKLTGKLTIAIADQEAQMELNQDTDTKIRVMEKWQKDL